MAMKITLYVLAAHHNATTRQCNPSIPRIAAYAGGSVAGTKRALGALERRGLIKRVRGGGRGKGTAYLLNFDRPGLLRSDQQNRLTVSLFCTQETGSVGVLNRLTVSPEIVRKEKTARAPAREGARAREAPAPGGGVGAARPESAPAGKQAEPQKWAPPPDEARQFYLRLFHLVPHNTEPQVEGDAASDDEEGSEQDRAA